MDQDYVFEEEEYEDKQSDSLSSDDGILNSILGFNIGMDLINEYN